MNSPSKPHTPTAHRGVSLECPFETFQPLGFGHAKLMRPRIWGREGQNPSQKTKQFWVEGTPHMRLVSSYSPAGMKLGILKFQHFKRRDYRLMPPCPDSVFSLKLWSSSTQLFFTVPCSLPNIWRNSVSLVWFPHRQTQLTKTIKYWRKKCIFN